MHDYSVPVVFAVAFFAGQTAIVAAWTFRALTGTAR